MNNISIKKILIVTAVLALIVIGVMFVIPVVGAVLLVSAGIAGLLMFSKWVVRLFNGGVDPDVNGDGEVPWEKDGHKLQRIGRSHQRIEDGEIIDEKVEK